MLSWVSIIRQKSERGHPQPLVQRKIGTWGQREVWVAELVELLRTLFLLAVLEHYLYSVENVVKVLGPQLTVFFLQKRDPCLQAAELEVGFAPF